MRTQATVCGVNPARVAIRRYVVQNPDDQSNPIPIDTREGIVLVYHGTSLVHSDSIERFGFDRGRLPYMMEDIIALNRAYETFHWFGLTANGYAVTKGFTAGSGNAYVSDKRISFSYHYEYARSYATNIGGESIESLLTAIDEFEKFANDPNMRRSHVEELERKLATQPPNWPPRNAIVQYLDASKDEGRIQFFLRELLDIRSRYDHIRQDHHPVVYAVRAEPELFSKPPARGETDLRALRPIPLDSIVARIDFPNGIGKVDLTTCNLEEPTI